LQAECDSRENISLGHQFTVIDYAAVVGGCMTVYNVKRVGALYSLRLEINFVITVLFRIKSLATSLVLSLTGTTKISIMIKQ